MAEDVDVPKVGKVKPKVLVPIVVAAVGFIGWRYYVARHSPATGDESPEPGFDDPGVLPGVAGAVRPDNDYGSNDQPQPSTDDFGFHGTTNAQWTDYAATKLSQSDRWSYTDIVTALGNYLGGVPLSSAQQDIVRAAIGLAGYPPVGTHAIVPGGNTALTVAPTGVRATPTATTLTVSFTPVPGAATYNVYRSNSTGSTVHAQGTGSSSPVVLTGLTPNTSYSVQVAGVSSAGTVGPKSSAITAKTSTVALATPPKPTVSAITSTSAHLTTKAVPFATGYKWTINGRLAVTNSPAWTATKMRPKSTYTVTVAASMATGNSSKPSAPVSFKTK